MSHLLSLLCAATFPPAPRHPKPFEFARQNGWHENDASKTRFKPWGRLWRGIHCVA